MGEQRNTFRSTHDQITIPSIWVGFALSLIFHAAVLIGRPPRVLNLAIEEPREEQREGKSQGSLRVRIAPPPSLPLPGNRTLPMPEIIAVPSPARLSAAPKAGRRRATAPAPRVLAMQGPDVTLASPPIAPPPPAESVRAPAAADFASLIQARREARRRAGEPGSAGAAQGVPSPPLETEQERDNRIVAENLGLNRPPGIGAERKPGGGIFQIRSMNYTDAEVLFFGWNKEIRRNSRQVIDVRRGANPSIEIAVVRKMILIIRENAREDFLWESPRLGRNVTLSARSADNAGLEDFLMREFFPEFRQRP